MTIEPTIMVGSAASDDKGHEVVKQIEFYFNDANLPYDKYMWTLHSKTPEHWVPISIVASFNRMRALLSGESGGVPWIAEKIREKSTELEVDETGENVRRNTEPRPPTNVFDRSVYAKGFGFDEKDGVLLNEIQTFLGKWGKVNVVRMRRDNDKKFKSSIFAEFEEIESARNFVEAPQEEKMWDGEPLTTMTKESYCLKKMKEKGISGDVDELRKSANLPSNGRQKSKFNAFREMRQAALKDTPSGSLSKDDEQAMPQKILISYGSEKIEVNADGTVSSENVKFPPQSIIEISGIGDGTKSYGEIKNVLKPIFGRPPHITFDEGTSTGLFIFTQTVTDEQLEQIKEKVTKIGGAEVVYTRADETKEREVHEKNITQVAKNTISTSKSSGGNRASGKGSHGGRGGRHGGGGGRGGGRSGGSTAESKRSNAPPPIASTATASAVKRKADDHLVEDASAKKAKTEAITSTS